MVTNSLRACTKVIISCKNSELFREWRYVVVTANMVSRDRCPRRWNSVEDLADNSDRYAKHGSKTLFNQKWIALRVLHLGLFVPKSDE